MARTIFIFYTNCRDPKREKELSDWYNHVHIPDVEAIPGFTSCIRYRISSRTLDGSVPLQSRPATYISIVEADLDVETAISGLNEAVGDWHNRGRMSDLFVVVSAEIVTEENPSARSKIPRI